MYAWVRKSSSRTKRAPWLAVPAGPGRLLSEIIAAAESRGSSALLDGDFARDLEEVINSHPEPLDPPAWD